MAATLAAQSRRVTVYCFYCGKEFIRALGQAVRANHQFCCREHALAARRERLVQVRSGQARVKHNVDGMLTGRQKAAIAAEYGVTWEQLEQVRALGLTAAATARVLGSIRRITGGDA